MPIGPYGADEYGHGQAYFPGCLHAFSVRPGVQGPQVVASWEVPEWPVDGIMIRRKLGEHPRTPDEGVLVLLEQGRPMDVTWASDVADDLLPTDAEPGEGRWWYYRAFVRPVPVPLEEQLAGLAAGELTLAEPESQVWDVQDYLSATLYLEALGDDPVQVLVEGAPTRDGPWVPLSSTVVPSGERASVDVPPEACFVRARLTDGAAALYWLCPQLEPAWLSNDALTGVVYVFRTGRHLEAVLAGALPEVYLARDGAQNLASVFEVQGPDGESWNLGEDGAARGHLWKFLSIYLAELDRVDAYLGAVRRYAADVDEMPPQEFLHVAQMLGYPLEVDRRDLLDVREEVFRIAGVWKAKGTARLIGAVCEQVLGVVPRVQEGAGRLIRVMDPDLLGVDSAVVNSFIGG